MRKFPFYSYSVSSLFGSDESEANHWIKVSVPPQFEESDPPPIFIENKENSSNVFFVKRSTSINEKCKVK